MMLMVGGHAQFDVRPISIAKVYFGQIIAIVECHLKVAPQREWLIACSVCYGSFCM